MGRSTFEYVDTCCFCLLTLCFTLNASITSEKCFSLSSGRRQHHRRDLKSVKSFCSGKIPCTYVPTILLQKNLILESTVFPTHSKTDTPQRVKMFPYVFVFLIVIVFVFVRVFVSLMVSYKEMSSAPTRSLSKRDTSCCASPVAKGAPARDPEVQNILNWAIGNIWTSVLSVLRAHLKPALVAAVRARSEKILRSILPTTIQVSNIYFYNIKLFCASTASSPMGCLSSLKLELQVLWGTRG